MSSNNGIRKFHILIVEDNPGDIYLLRRALEQAGVNCELTVIEDGGKAVTFVREYGQKPGSHAVDLAVLDLNLPKDDGVDILQTMRASPAFAHVPAVVLSSSSSPRDLEKVQESGVKRYLTKPEDLDQFLCLGETLKDLLAESRAHGSCK